MRWEWFLDESYFGMYAVRPVGDKDFNSRMLFHVQNENEAKALHNLLSSMLETAGSLTFQNGENIVVSFTGREFIVVKEYLYRHSLHNEEVKAFYEKIKDIGSDEKIFHSKETK